MRRAAMRRLQTSGRWWWRRFDGGAGYTEADEPLPAMTPPRDGVKFQLPYEAT